MPPTQPHPRTAAAVAARDDDGVLVQSAWPASNSPAFPTPAIHRRPPAAAVFQRTQSGQIDSTRATGVCCNMNSLTRISQPLMPDPRQGRSRHDRPFQSKSPSAGTCHELERVSHMGDW